MTHESISTTVKAWIHAKHAETQAIEHRRQLEDLLRAALAIPESLDGTLASEHDGYEIKFVGRMNRKIDDGKLQEIAAEHGTSLHLATLFRWKPEIDAKAWKAADPSITTPLLAAITTTPGRPTLSIKELEKEKV